MTLVELLIGISMMVVIMFASLPLIDGASKTESRVETASVKVGDARVFTEKVIRDLRSAYEVVPTPNASSVSVNTYVRHTVCGNTNPSAETAPPIQCRVTYTCAGVSPTIACSRQERNPNGTGTGAAINMVTGLTSSNVFAYTPSAADPSFVSVNVVLAGRETGEDAITLQDGATLRNISQ